jgi:hypothetical protein
VAALLGVIMVNPENLCSEVWVFRYVHSAGVPHEPSSISVLCPLLVASFDMAYWVIAPRLLLAEGVNALEVQHFGYQGVRYLSLNPRDIRTNDCLVIVILGHRIILS